VNQGNRIRLGLTASIRDDPSAVEEYVRAHAAIWPEVIADSRVAGVIVTCIFRDGRNLFMYMETEPGFDLDSYADQLSSPRTLEWQRWMDGLLDDQPGAAPGLKWRPLEMIALAV